MLRYGIPSYKLEKDVIEAEIDVMREMGVEIKTGVEVGKDISLDELLQGILSCDRMFCRPSSGCSGR